MEVFNVMADTSADLCLGGVDSRMGNVEKQGDHLGPFPPGTFRIISRLIAKKLAGKISPRRKPRTHEKFFLEPLISQLFFGLPVVLALFGLHKWRSLHLVVLKKGRCRS